MAVTVSSSTEMSVPPLLSDAQRLHELEVAAGHLVEEHGAPAPEDLRGAQVFHASRPDLSHVGQQRSGGSDQHAVVLLEAERIEALHTVSSLQLV